MKITVNKMWHGTSYCGWYWEIRHEGALIEEGVVAHASRAKARAEAILRAEQIVAQWTKALAKMKARKEGGK